MLDGRFAADQAEIVLTVLDAEMERDRRNDETRNPAQRRADASFWVALAARIEAAHLGRLSKATLDRIACDCGVSRVIMHGKSEILDVGRATRTISPASWKALVARDRHCTHLHHEMHSGP